MITLIVMIMPATALVLPLFLEMDKIGLYGTVWSLILPFGFFPFGVYLAYIYFSSTIPSDLLAAARIDGAGEWRVFRFIAFRSRARLWLWWAFLRSSRPGTTSFCPSS